MDEPSGVFVIDDEFERFCAQFTTESGEGRLRAGRLSLLGQIELKAGLEQVERLLFQGDSLHGLDVPAVIAEELGALAYDARLVPDQIRRWR